MNLTEYNKVKDLSYSKYCDYLQKKYGIPSKPYFNKNFVKNTGITKTGEGLFLHHIKEDIGTIHRHRQILLAIACQNLTDYRKSF